MPTSNREFRTDCSRWKSLFKSADILMVKASRAHQTKHPQNVKPTGRTGPSMLIGRVTGFHGCNVFPLVALKTNHPPPIFLQVPEDRA